MTSAAEAHNKAALIASDCGLADLAQQLCWRQFDIFHAATPLTAKAAKLALQPIVNLGRVLTRGGEGTRAYRIFESARDAVRTQAVAEIDTRNIDFRDFVTHAGDRHELRKLLWTVLLADGTRALTQAGRWADALEHIQRHKGIGKRLLDGRQVAILARCAAGDRDGAIDLLDDSSTPDPWEQAVATCLRTLCLSIGQQSPESATETMVSHYLQLGTTPGHIVFRTRLGLCVLDLLQSSAESSGPAVAAKIVREAVTAADAYVAWDVLAHPECRSSATKAEELALTRVIESSGLRRGTIPADLLNDLLASVATSEAHLTQLLAR